jgi:MFS family permease
MSKQLKLSSSDYQ